MTEFQAQIQRMGLTEMEAMDLLQDNNVISDLCVWAADIAPSDLVQAVDWLKERHGR